MHTDIYCIILCFRISVVYKLWVTQGVPIIGVVEDLISKFIPSKDLVHMGTSDLILKKLKNYNFEF
jgi:hypothetical protein